mmetsp:Transcript_35381/g.57133  ORF Transcript_35381/g.57133 Transcript_35381/m.57133 type:complete len:178 (-) Transcript_35381:717-1250(-)
MQIGVMNHHVSSTALTSKGEGSRGETCRRETCRRETTKQERQTTKQERHLCKRGIYVAVCSLPHLAAHQSSSLLSTALSSLFSIHRLDLIMGKGLGVVETRGTHTHVSHTQVRALKGVVGLDVFGGLYVCRQGRLDMHIKPHGHLASLPLPLTCTTNATHALSVLMLTDLILTLVQS